VHAEGITWNQIKSNETSARRKSKSKDAGDADAKTRDEETEIPALSVLPKICPPMPSFPFLIISNSAVSSFRLINSDLVAVHGVCTLCCLV